MAATDGARDRFTKIPDDIARRHDLSPADKLVFGRLLRFQGAVVCPREAWIAEQLALSTDTVARATRRLERLGLIVVKRNRGRFRRTNSYRMESQNAVPQSAEPQTADSVAPQSADSLAPHTAVHKKQRPKKNDLRDNDDRPSSYFLKTNDERSGEKVNSTLAGVSRDETGRTLGLTNCQKSGPLRLSSRQGSATLAASLKQSSAALALESVSGRGLLESLSALDCRAPEAVAFVAKYGEEKVRAAVRLTNSRPRRNPAGFFREALARDWKPAKSTQPPEPGIRVRR